MIDDIVYVAGVAAIAYLILKIALSLFRGAYTTLIGPLLRLNTDFRRYGKWAVVTGATDGIGKAYAEQLAAQGISIVLISRSLDKLQKTAEAIESKYRVKTKVIAFDFTSSHERYEAIRNELADMEIGILVNNVGMSYSYPEYFADLPNGDKFSPDLVNCNIISTVMMSRIVLPGMQSRRKGVILNVASMAAVNPLPLYTLYSASKAFVDFFSRALQDEYRDKGIVIQSVLPGFVATNMSKKKPNGFGVPGPESYVRAQLKTVGLEDRTFGPIAHKLQGYGAEVVGQYLPKFVMDAGYLSKMKGANAKYHKKRKQQASKHD